MISQVYKFLILIVSYFGLAPFIWLFQKRIKEDFIKFHIKQSLVLWFWLILIMLILSVCVFLLTLVVVRFPDFYQNWEVELWFLSISRKLFLCWLVFLLFGFGCATLKSAKPLPFVSFWIKHKALFFISKFVDTVFLLFVLFLFVINIYSCILIYPQTEAPKVYVLYDNLDYLPQWIFNIGFFPIIKTGSEVYGKGNVALRVVGKESLSESLKNAEIVLIASHGTEEGILSREGFIKPKDVQEMEVNRNLKFVYLSGCKGGEQKEIWSKVFSPAKVLTYKRMTATFEHAWWFWRYGPMVIHGKYNEE
ncbi:MAG TPA: hypothetical protein PLX23_04685 [Candidatus Hydrogenedens sp.]|nr:hypothetical protein [Candidatus Hydrogenedens sp.]